MSEPVLDSLELASLLLLLPPELDSLLVADELLVESAPLLVVAGPLELLPVSVLDVSPLLGDPHAARKAIVEHRIARIIVGTLACPRAGS